MATTTGNISVTSSATEILAPSPDRKGYVVQNISASNVYIGPTSSITTSNTIYLGPGEKMGLGGFMDRWNGAVYGIVSSGTADVRFWEWGQ